MSTNTPSDLNFLSISNFDFRIRRAPNVTFFLQSVSIPFIGLPSPDMPTPMQRIPFPGDHLQYEDLTIQFKLDEQLAGYLEIHNWLTYIGRKTEADYAAIASQPKETDLGIRSDLVLTLLDGNHNPKFEFVFHDAFPYALSGIELSTQVQDIQYLNVRAAFKYTLFDVNPIT